MSPDVSRFSHEELCEAFDFLDDLRESGVTNMWGATAYVERALDHSKEDARTLLSAWMRTFDGQSSVDDRANKARAA